MSKKSNYFLGIIANVGFIAFSVLIFDIYNSFTKSI